MRYTEDVPAEFARAFGRLEARMETVDRRLDRHAEAIRAMSKPKEKTPWDEVVAAARAAAPWFLFGLVALGRLEAKDAIGLAKLLLGGG